MTISKLELSEYVNSSESFATIRRIALDTGFVADIENGDEGSSREEQGEIALYAINAVGIRSINELDLMILSNDVKIKEILERCIINKGKYRKWGVFPESLCELAMIAIKPDIFTKEYQERQGWQEDVIKVLEEALKSHHS